jgi:hypothetical protein
MPKLLRPGVVVALTALTLAALPGVMLGAQPEPPPSVDLVTPDGREFSGVPDGDRLLVDPSIDPDGFIKNTEATARALQAPPLPTCVYARDNHPTFGLAYLHVDNDCTTPQRVKVLIAFSFDSSCMTVAPKTTVEFQYPNAARFDGLEAC